MTLWPPTGLAASPGVWHKLEVASDGSRAAVVVKGSVFRAASVALISLLCLALSACETTSHGVPLSTGAGVPILLFNGTGTSTGDVAAVEKILGDNHLA